MEKENFKIWLNQELNIRGWSLGELSRRTGISVPTISLFLSDQRNPKVDFYISVADALRIDREDVLRKVGILSPLPPVVAQEKEIVRIVRRLSDTDLHAALTMLRGLSHSIPVVPALAEPRSSYNPSSNASLKIIDTLWALIPDWKKRDLIDQYQRQVERQENDE